MLLLSTGGQVLKKIAYQKHSWRTTGHKIEAGHTLRTLGISDCLSLRDKLWMAKQIFIIHIFILFTPRFSKTDTAFHKKINHGQTRWWHCNVWGCFAAWGSEQLIIIDGTRKSWRRMSGHPFVQVHLWMAQYKIKVFKWPNHCKVQKEIRFKCFAGP